ncbi:hypothetical protein MKZ38_009814 [Zalerion maritima]|uniref:Uncharacterized protein n=1 Tax=Zalerion maritima TaxID=339359 RepID=A0AAD5WXE5_9PEZI|nr:hypothetical protein MKZ38_009814 [Zalerion maritima]
MTASCRRSFELGVQVLSTILTSSFTMELKTHVSAAGPVSATMSAMTVDLFYGDVSLGKLELPEVCTSFGGFELHVLAQKITILDMNSFKSFVTDIMLKLKTLACMGGPKVKMVRTESLGGGKIKNTMVVENPSPLELSHVITSFKLISQGGETVATVNGDLLIKRGDFETEATGEVITSSKAGAGEELVRWSGHGWRQLD